VKRVVWKYTLGETASAVAMPRGAEVLHVAEQHGVFCIWVLVDPMGPVCTRAFRITGTGHEMTDWSPDWKFVGTFLVQGGYFVFHVWDCGETL
jgi:hypothetical protein